jgi:hypothetical protein
MNHPSPAGQKERQKIIALIDDLPADSLPLVEAFIRFMQTQQPDKPSEKSEQTPWLYPTVPVPPESLMKWTELLTTDYEGDALADTEGFCWVACHFSGPELRQGFFFFFSCLNMSFNQVNLIMIG